MGGHCRHTLTYNLSRLTQRLIKSLYGHGVNQRAVAVSVHMLAFQYSQPAILSK